MSKFIKKISFSIFAMTVLFAAKIEEAGAQVPIDIKNPITTNDFGEIVENVLLWLLSVAGVITIFMLVVGGIMYMTAGGNEQKVATAKKVITWTIIGLGLILVSYSIMAVLDKILVQ
ncbi:MAG: hypothetical protein U9N04_00715 [Patescibacteria group bacterium]|nr:hypothetical protein [Patescibacteria group bacterium]